MRKARPTTENYWMGRRVELHPATDRWMMGDRYGEVIRVNRSDRDETVILTVLCDKSLCQHRTVADDVREI